MAKNKISEYSSIAANNTDISGINIAEGCAPSGINNAIRELMAQLKDQQAGTDGDNFTVGGNLVVTGTATGVTPAVTDDTAKFATTAFVRDILPTGVIVMWSGTVATIPSGWLLCNGSNGTPDLRNRFVIGANADDAGVAKTNVTGSATKTGGSKDAIVVDHTHTMANAGSATGTINSSFLGDFGNFTSASGVFSLSQSYGNRSQGAAGTGSLGLATLSIPDHTHTINNSGSSGTNANLVPYYALAFIMKS